jgi:hypothetical protein
MYYWSEEMVSSINAVTLSDCLVPNPYQPGTPIHCPDLHETQAVVEIIDVMGRTLLTKRISASKFTVNPTVAPGMYILRITIDQMPYHIQKLYITE